MTRRGRTTAATTALVSAASGAVIAAVALARLVSQRYLRVAVAGESMTPALLPEDFLVLRAGPPRPEHAFGRIVAVHDPRPEGNGRLLLKRVVGLPGESLRVGGGVQVNGLLLEEPWAHGETPTEQHRGINRLEAGRYFLLGDNRGASTDSRDFGPIPAEDVVGTAVLRYWPPRRFGRLRQATRRFVDTPAAESDAEHHHNHDDAPASPTTQPLPWLERRPND